MLFGYVSGCGLPPIWEWLFIAELEPCLRIGILAVPSSNPPQPFKSGSAQIALTKTFEKSLARLTNVEQAQVKQMPTDFLLNPEKAGHRLHKLNSKEKRFRSISVNMDLRIIALQEENLTTFCYVDHHDNAYKWANRRKFEVHPVTGSAQLVELEEVIREEAFQAPPEKSASRIFADEDDDYLLSLGIPQAWMETVKKVDFDGLLIDCRKKLRKHCFNWLMEGVLLQPRSRIFQILLIIRILAADSG